MFWNRNTDSPMDSIELNLPEADIKVRGDVYKRKKEDPKILARGHDFDRTVIDLEKLYYSCCQVATSEVLGIHPSEIPADIWLKIFYPSFGLPTIRTNITLAEILEAKPELSYTPKKPDTSTQSAQEQFDKIQSLMRRFIEKHSDCLIDINSELSEEEQKRKGKVWLSKILGQIREESFMMFFAALDINRERGVLQISEDQELLQCAAEAAVYKRLQSPVPLLHLHCEEEESSLDIREAVQTLIEKKKEHLLWMKKVLPVLKVRDGFLALVDEADKLGQIQGIVSSSRSDIIKLALSGLGLWGGTHVEQERAREHPWSDSLNQEGYFPIIIGSELFTTPSPRERHKEPKPSGDPYRVFVDAVNTLRIMHGLSPLSPDQVAASEDNATGALSGLNAGLQVNVVPLGESPWQFMESLKAKIREHIGKTGERPQTLRLSIAKSWADFSFSS